MNNLKMLLKLYLLLFSCFSFSQNENELSRHNEVNEFVKHLLSRKIDTICDYEVFNEETEALYTQYVLWNENGKTKIKKLEHERNYPVVETNADEIWQFLLKNRENIKSENVKPFSFMKGNKLHDIVSEGGNFQEFNLYIGGEILRFWTSSFDFQKIEKINGKKVENVNFEHNNNLNGKLVLDKFQKLFKELEKQELFKG